MVFTLCEKVLVTTPTEMILAVSLLVLLFASDASCETVVTYNSRPSEELLCPIIDTTVGATWRDETTGNTLANYVKGGEPDIEIAQPGLKHSNFMYSASASSFSLFIQPVEAEDGGDYVCIPLGGGSTTEHSVVVEVLAKPTVQYELQDVDVLNVTVGTSYDLTCSATARSVDELSLVWEPSLVVETPLDIKPSSEEDYKDYSITSTYTAVRGVSNITCQLTGYAMQDEINDQRLENISHTVNLNVRYVPVCSMTLLEGEDCRNVTLTCKCDAVPADITQYSFFNPSLIYNGANNTFTTSVAYGTLSSFSCSATNSIGPGNQTDAKDHNCDEGTTALPTTTIVTTAPMSTKEPTSTKAMETTTEEPNPKGTDNPGPSALGTGAIVGIIVGVVAVVIVIVVIAVIMCKKGKCGSKSESSSVADGNVTATNSNITSSEPPAPVYGVVKKDSKKKSDKPEDNGAGPGKDPEIPAYGVIDKNRTKDPTPAPRSSMRDSKNPSKPKQDGPMEMKYADLDHGNKPPSDEVRKPKEEPTEYATVQPVIV